WSSAWRSSPTASRAATRCATRASASSSRARPRRTRCSFTGTSTPSAARPCRRPRWRSACAAPPSWSRSWRWGCRPWRRGRRLRRSRAPPSARSARAPRGGPRATSSMRQFGSSGFRLWNLGLEAKILYTAFCVLTLLGIVSSALYYGDLVGGGLGGIRRYYAGTGPGSSSADMDAGGAGARAADRAGPIIEVPPDADAQRAPLVVAVTYRKLLEV